MAWTNRGIGHYIHYKGSNYIKHGLEPSGKESNSLICSNLAEEHQKILHDSNLRGKTEKAKELEKKLNTFYGGSMEDGGKADKFTEQEYEMILDMLTSNLTNLTDNMELDLPHLDVSYKEDLHGLRGTKENRLMKDKLKWKEYINLDSLYKSMESLKKVIENINKKFGDRISNGTLPIEFLDRIREAEMSLQNVWNSAPNFEYRGKTQKQVFTNADILNFAESQNSLRKYLIQSKAIVKGELGEYGVAGIIAALEANSLHELEDIFKQLNSGKPGGTKMASTDGITISMRGNESSYKTFSQDNFYLDLGYMANEFEKAANESEKDFARYCNSINEDGDMVSLTKSQDKVDVSITIKNEQPINLSVKNYDFTSKGLKAVTIHTGNLLRLIQDQTTVINHYLNIVPQREYIGAGNAQIARWKPFVQNIMESAILVKGLQGGIHSTEGLTAEADYFVVNKKLGKNKQQFSVWAMKDLVNIVEKNKKMLQVTYHPDPETAIKNQWIDIPGENTEYYPSVQQAYVRARQMVYQFAKISIQAKIRKELLK